MNVCGSSTTILTPVINPSDDQGHDILIPADGAQYINPCGQSFIYLTRRTDGTRVVLRSPLPQGTSVRSVESPARSATPR